MTTWAKCRDLSLSAFMALVFSGACSQAAVIDLLSQFTVENTDQSGHMYSETSGESSRSCDASKFKIVVDAGHTVEAPGATSARGIREFSFNTILADTIGKTLKSHGFQHTVTIVSHGIGQRQLENRVLRANNIAPDLFISVHHDDVQETYHSKWTYDGKRYSYSDLFSGYSIFVSSRNTHAAQSVAFAQLLGTELVARGLHHTDYHSLDIPGERRTLLDSQRGVYQFDDLVVLKKSKAPALLLEAGIIVNRADELILASEQHRELIAEAVAMAVLKFCTSHRWDKD